MKQEEEEAAAAAMLNPDKAPEVKIYAKGICCFVFLQQVKIFVKNLHKVKIYLFYFLFKKWKCCVVHRLIVVMNIDKNEKRMSFDKK